MSEAEQERRQRRMRWWFPVIVLGLVGSVWGWAGHTEFVFREHLRVVSGVVGAGLLAFWYLFLTGLPWRRRFLLAGCWVLVLVVLGFIGKALLRVEGSLDGGSLPRLVWKWAPKPGDAVGALEIAESVEVEGGGVRWPGYLGEGRDGVAEGGWEAGVPEVVWKREIGLGWSSFAVAEGLAVTQEQRGEEEMVTAYALETGEPVWAFGVEARFSEHFGGDGPRSTPTIAGSRVYAQGATGWVHCLELADGAVVWSKDLLAETGGKNQEWGKSNAPLVVGDAVVLTGGDGGAELVCVDAGSGEVRWAFDRSDESDPDISENPSYSSPVMMTLGGQAQVVVVNAKSASGHDVENGAELWRFGWPKPFPKVSQPLALGEGELLLTSGYGAGSFRIRVTGGEGGWAVEKVWDSIRMKTKFSSAVVHGGYAYGLDEARFACMDLSNGKRLWRDGKYGYGQNLLLGDHILVQAEKGGLVLVEANPEELVETWTLEVLEGMTWNVPAVAGEYLLVRNGAEMACLRKPAG